MFQSLHDPSSRNGSRSSSCFSKFAVKSVSALVLVCINN